MSADGELERLSADDHAFIDALITRLRSLPPGGRLVQLAFVALGIAAAWMALRAQNWALLALSAAATLGMLWFTRPGRYIARIQRAAAGGHKRVRVARVDDRYADEHVFVLVLDGIPTAVDRRWFDRCQRGDRVCLDTLPGTEVLVGLRVIEAAHGPDGPP